MALTLFFSCPVIESFSNSKEQTLIFSQMQ